MAPEFLEPSKVYRNKVPHLAASSKTLGVHAQKVKIHKHCGNPMDMTMSNIVNGI
jgi:hypothetical protein